jgi:hypothetical protein
MTRAFRIAGRTAALTRTTRAAALGARVTAALGTSAAAGIVTRGTRGDFEARNDDARDLLFEQRLDRVDAFGVLVRDEAQCLT